ncbi:LOW QUALITY PROTEIN: SR-related and CTD-associated factor 8 [Coregonus clupeaformis]|uniref:LOW QUALITY PROTEIN: SR-related and CTD-associated factor 8 n=1 Tax=Coregonus clupeaformis TaxID=59861 RepID=UPI001E1C297F|nr:LOW QUALITY PROTEIN: SR-related and CTD-associated factor 8 [Coregonus clupeaformis]
MEAVKAFNGELYSLNEYKPPISKAKMTNITKSAIKAIKYYKHVVQGVEKFVQKCKPEYKVPGLYVMDSIVRQSRHQFGQDKDVFAPRFSKNIIGTFQHLYRCPSDDKSKIVRVLNLWQKNAVFKSDIIQPLLDMAAGLPPPSVTPVMTSRDAQVNNTTPGTPATPATPANIVSSLPDWASQFSNTDTVAAVAQILQSPHGQQLQQLVQSLQLQQQKPQPSLLQALDAGLVVQLQALTAQLTAAASANPMQLNPLEQRISSFNKKMLGHFDFGNDSERSEDSKKDAHSSQMPMVSDSIFHQLAEQLQQQNLEQFQKQLMEHQQKSMNIEGQDGIFGSESSAMPQQSSSQSQHPAPQNKMDDSIDNQQQDMDLDDGPEMEEERFEPEDKKSKMVDTWSRTRSRSRSRSPRKRRSRSRSGSRKRKHRKRSRSRSRERKRKSSRSYSSERQAREREKERQKKGLPPIRSKFLSVCSTTLWVGQVDKKASQQDLTNLFEEFGQIESINMIPPRGCAYICMVHRQDAYRARQKLSTGSFKIVSKVIKIAWALNKGVKQEYKQFWDMDLGVTYIPWEKVKLDDLDGFAEGGMIDQETVNAEWEAAKNAPEPMKEAVSQAVSVEPIAATNTQQTQEEAFSQQVSMMPVQLPVRQAVPAVGLVPPSFPVSMAMPPPGYGPLPPFLRAGFNASQPPPGFMQAAGVPQQAGMGSAPTSLVPASMSQAQDSMKDSPYGATIPGSFMPSALPGQGVFNQLQPGVQTQQGANDKTGQSADGMDAAAELVLQGMQNAMSRGMGLLGMHPSASLTHPLHQQGLPGQRMPGLMPLDLRPTMLQGSGARFPLLMQQGLSQQSLLEASLHAQARARAASQMERFNRAEEAFNRGPNPPNESMSKAEDEPSSAADDSQQGGDQDYRFPPPQEKQSTGLLRTPPLEHRESMGIGGGGAGGGGMGGGRPALLQTPVRETARDSVVGRLQALAGFTPQTQSRWGPPRGDFDERDMRGSPAGVSKGFQEERPGSNQGQNFPNRFENQNRVGSAGGVGGGVCAGGPGGGGVVGGPAWSRGGVDAAAPFADADMPQDLDECRRPWDRQQRDRDFDFRKEMNGNRRERDSHEKERDRERERDRGRERGNREREQERDREREREKEREKERERDRNKRGAWTPLLPLPQPLLPTPTLTPTLSLTQGKPQALLQLQSKLQPKPGLLTKPGLLQTPTLLTRSTSQVPTKSLLQAPSQSPPKASPQSNQFPTQAKNEALPGPEPQAEFQTQSSQNQSPPQNHASLQAQSPPPAHSPFQTKSPPQAQSSSRARAQSPPQALSPPQAQSPPQVSPQAPSIPDEITDTQGEPEKPQEEPIKEPEPMVEPPSQWVNGTGSRMDTDAVAEPTPTLSPTPAPSMSLVLTHSPVEPQCLPEPLDQQQPPQHATSSCSSTKDVDNGLSEPMEEAEKQPVVEKTDTEGTIITQ